MKTNIPSKDKKSTYIKGLKHVDWKEVAFNPFTPEACKKKWGEILQKLQKIRTLSELIVEAEDIFSNPLQNTKNHPEHPKRPSPPNATFCEENWARCCTKHPNMKQSKIMRRLSKKYQALPEKEKAQYVEKFNLETVEYQKKMKEFRKQYITSPNKKRKKLSDDSTDQVQGKEQTEDVECLPPKPPTNGYNIFCKEQRMFMMGLPTNAYTTVWAQRWRDLTDTEREQYKLRCKEMKREYTVKLNEYLQTVDKEEQQKFLKEKGLKRPKEQKPVVRKVAKKIPGEPRKPFQAGNTIFYKKQMLLLKDAVPNSRLRLTKINQMWLELSVEEKNRYKKEATEKLIKYSKELQQWFKTLSRTQKEAYQNRNPSVRTYHIQDSEDEMLENSSCKKMSEFEEDEEEEEDGKIIAFDIY
ncbi:nucleolar transcription factor 1-like isoform X2 [Eleginops maclovinus]|uniref:nucleolar transcription factor 1-like isoform X2 n=1 Tax=Eleginops maclovinus TaxID=56733 RepID=UPI00307FF474